MSETSDETQPKPPASDAAADADAATQDGHEVARKAGRGGLAVAGAKIYFIVVGLVQQIALPQVLGAAGYGALSRVLSMASIAYNPIVLTSIQGTSRAIAQATPEEEPAAIRRTLIIHVLLAVLAALGFVAIAPMVANATGAPHIITSLYIVSGVLLLYGVYTPFVGVLNGRKKFLHQAGLDAGYATLRTIGLIGGGWWFAKKYSLGVEGSTVGFVSAAGLICLIAGSMVGLGRAGKGGPTVKEHLKFIAPLLIGQILFNLLLQADLQLVGYFASKAAASAGLPLTDADKLVGAYRSTQLFCFLPYQLLIAVTFILFPMLAASHKDGDMEAVARYVKTGVRLAMVLAGAMVSVTSGLSGRLIDLVFPGTGYAQLGGQSMQILTLGFGAFAIFGILITVLNSLKKESASMALTGLAFALVVVVCFVIVPGAEFGPGLLIRTAIATTTGLLAAALTTAFLVYRTAGGVVAPLSLVRVLAALAIAITAGRFMPAGGKVMTIVYALVVGVVYLVVLLATRELTKDDLGMVLAVVRKKKA